MSKQLENVYNPYLLDPVLHDTKYYMESLLYIKNKNRQVIPFLLNPIQGHYLTTHTNRDLILKARQMGFSTFILGRYFKETVTRANTVTVIVAHDVDSTGKLLKSNKMMYDFLDPDFKPATRWSNTNELTFDFPAPPGAPATARTTSSVYIGTAGNRSFGRGDTINNFHGSEVAFWPDAEELLSGAMEAVPMDGNITLESTANGVGGWFYEEWQLAKNGESQFKPHFFPWFLDPNYRIPLERGESLEPYDDDEIMLIATYKLDPAQIKWRRMKKRALRRKFPQEYPENDIDCFLNTGDSYFDMDHINEILPKVQGIDPLEVRQVPGGMLKVWKKPEPGRKYDIGVDVSEGIWKGDGKPGDYSGAGVLDAVTKEQVACLHGHWKPERLAYMVSDLGEEYNRGRLAVERNNHGHTCLNELINHIHYPNLYYHTDYDKDQNIRKLAGWPTTPKTRPILLDNLSTAILEGGIKINDPEFLKECRTFVRNAAGKYQAQTGCYDDRVMKWGIALQVSTIPWDTLPEEFVVY